MNNFVQQGQTESVIAPANVASGAGVLVGHKFGIASYTALSGAVVEVSRVGVYDIAKDTSTFIDGDLVYWDNTAKAATSTSTSNRAIGTAAITLPDGTSAKGTASGDATVRVNLVPTLA